MGRYPAWATFPPSVNWVWCVIMLVSSYVGCACPAADEVCVFISVHVHRHALAVLQNCRKALVTLLFWTGCFQPLVLAVIQQSGLSVCSPPSFTLASGDQTVNLAHSALMTSLMVWGNSQLYSCDVIAGVVWMLHCSSGLKHVYVQLSVCVCVCVTYSKLGWGGWVCGTIQISSQ